jgi:hypothetical protein
VWGLPQMQAQPQLDPVASKTAEVRRKAPENQRSPHRQLSKAHRPVGGPQKDLLYKAPQLKGRAQEVGQILPAKLGRGRIAPAEVRRILREWRRNKLPVGVRIIHRDQNNSALEVKTLHHVRDT